MTDFSKSEMLTLLKVYINDQLDRRSKFEDESARDMCLDRIMGMLIYAKAIQVIDPDMYDIYYTKYVEDVQFENQ